MSKRRREWKESLKKDVKSSEAKSIEISCEKKKKVEVLNEKIFRNLNGELLLIKNTDYTTNHPSVISNNTLQETNRHNIQMTPHQSYEKHSVKNLTPTFRKPEMFLQETKKVLNSLTPSKTISSVVELPLEVGVEEVQTNNLQEDESIIAGPKGIEAVHVQLSDENVENMDQQSLGDLQLFDLTDITMPSQTEATCDQTYLDVEVNTIKNMTSINELAKIADDWYSDEDEDDGELKKKCSKRKLEFATVSHIENSDESGYNPIEITKEELPRSFQVVQAEVYTDPVKRTHVKQDRNICEKNVISYDIDDGIVALPNEDIIANDPLSHETAETGSNTSNKTTSKKNNPVKRSLRNVRFNKSYFDYMSDDDLDQLLLNEAFPSEASDEEHYTENSSDISSCVDKPEKKHKKKKRKSAEHNNDNDHNISATKEKPKGTIRKENIEKRNKGDCYTNDKGKLIECKKMKPNTCIGKKCGNECSNITEEKRLSLFTYFWNLNSHQRRKDWIAQCAIKKSIKRPGKHNTRSCTYDYYINEGEGRRRVCQKYLMNTLDITQRFILYTLGTMNNGLAKADGRGKCGGSNKTKEEIIEHAKSFIKSLPLVPSHYCRKDSKRLYFPAEFKNLTNLYRIYQSKCKNSGIKGMSLQVFKAWFSKLYNIGFHVPKKDKCSICISIKEKTNDADKPNIERHIQEKDTSYQRFKYHQRIHQNDKSIVCASFDMQKVLNTPYGDSMMLYYSRKLAVHNLAIYESFTRKAYCNIWTEADAYRGGNEISTCLYYYIKDVDSRTTVKTLLLYCDSCYGQNKNKIVLSMIRFALSKCEYLTTIQINYLIPGHTYMPVDSVHATIENKTKKCTVWAPSQWPTIMEVARQDPEPYKVEVLRGKDFFGFSEIVNATFKKNAKFAISKLNIATFRKHEPNVLYIKNSMLFDAETFCIPLLTLTNKDRPKTNLYPSLLGIAANKYNDLIKLVDKNIIPARFAAEYKNLKISTKVKDCLVDTDEEDEVPDHNE